jgi:hypothetical protein
MFGCLMPLLSLAEALLKSRPNAKLRAVDYFRRLQSRILSNLRR